jgi:eukaryotic-like serine/threonine-protein kinase
MEETSAPMKILGGRYELGTKLGAGGMGVVYRAYDQRLKREVAIKWLHEWLVNEPEVRRRFSQEAEMLARLRHPNIVHVYDFEEAGEVAFIVMELVDGPNLAEDTSTQLPLPRTCRWSWHRAPAGRPRCRPTTRGRA